MITKKFVDLGFNLNTRLLMRVESVSKYVERSKMLEILKRTEAKMLKGCGV